MNTGENEQALRKILDFTRLASVTILILHFYYYCYGLFATLELRNEFADRILTNLERTGLYHTPLISKLLTLALLFVSLVGAKGKKSEHIQIKQIIIYLCTGLSIYFAASLLFHTPLSSQVRGTLYILVTSLGYLLALTGGSMLSRLIDIKLGKDIFNDINETFPQEERLLENEYSINLPAVYNLRGKMRKSWINIINPFRGLLVCGTPGSGKSYFIIQHVIRQHIAKGFTMLVYDFKYDDLTRIAFNTLSKHKSAYKITPQFYTIHFDDLSKTHRCNPLDPSTMFDITDASEASRSILLGLNRDWITKQGDFFVESPINFLTAIIWFLKKYEDGRYLTLPHVIELMQADYESLFSVLRTEPEIEVLINPFISAYENDAMEQLEGQIASAKIGMARLASPQLYWVLSKSDFTLDINNPDSPKIVCLANNPQKQQIYGAVLSLYVNRLIKLVNQKNKLKSSLIFDEFPTIFFNGMDNLIATARANRVATCLGIQDFSQLKKDYGADQSSVILNITGNIISGQVTGETAKFLSERFGKINQVKESISINRTDTSVSKSTQLDFAIPPSRIASLSSGEFVGMVADNPDDKIKLKTFHCEVLNDHASLHRESSKFKKLPHAEPVTPLQVTGNFNEIKMDIKHLVQNEINALKERSNNPLPF